MDLNVGVAEALGTDYFYIREQLTSAQLVYLARTREFVTTRRGAQRLSIPRGESRRCWPG